MHEGQEATSLRIDVVLLGIVVGALIVLLLVFVSFTLIESSPDRVLAATTEGIQAVASMRFAMEADIESSGIESSMTAEGVMSYPSGMEMTSVVHAEGETLRIDQVIVDGVLYMRMGADPQWRFVSVGSTVSAEPGTDMTPDTYLAYLESSVDVTDLGVEKVDGVECHHLAVDIDESRVWDIVEAQSRASGVKLELPTEVEEYVREVYENSTIAVDVWVAVDDELPRREVVSMRGTEPEPFSILATIEFSDFDEAVAIKAPEGAIAFDE